MSSRMTSERVAMVETELTERDRALVAMLAAVKLANGNQLRRATHCDNSPAAQRAARRQLARLVRWRVVARLERRQGGLGRGSEAWTYALDATGLRLIGDGARARRPHLPGRAMWAHALVGAEVYTQLAEATRGTERSVEVWEGEPSCWRSYAGGYAERLLLKPDAFVVVSGPGYEDAAFVEADAGSQSRTVIRAKLASYRSYAATGQEQAAHDGVFPLTVFVTTTAERQAVLTELVDELPTDARRFFVVGQVADAARLLTGGGS
jgi:Replication-relaxation